MKHYTSVEILTNFQYQVSLHNRKAPLVNIFWRRLWVDWLQRLTQTCICSVPQ